MMMAMVVFMMMPVGVSGTHEGDLAPKPLFVMLNLFQHPPGHLPERL